MSANSNLNEALGVLGDKLQSLNAMVLANQFMIDAVRDHEAKLKALDAEAARSFMRQIARKKFGEDEAMQDVLALILNAMAPRQSAEIIQFPG
ncbi:hypothetical protein DL239_19295 [Sedimentitalea sp. CY04]|uniref:Uncharacterized protein n=1 Tax=Parasedimentitalea denitrificans TaxID=2211118 RepID=A0ABX0WBP7_9RHOB|nr:hypothetical protein [Sedimentitalea sp. CY04]NIZ63114.1 hypothetical protein [Sedimentitalea sp. CY04]